MESWEYHSHSIVVNKQEKSFVITKEKLIHSLFSNISQQLNADKKEQLSLFKDGFQATLLKNGNIIAYDFKSRADGIQNDEREQFINQNTLFNHSLNTFFKRVSVFEIDKNFTSSMQLIEYLQKLSIDELLRTNLVYINDDIIYTGCDLLDFHDKIKEGLAVGQKPSLILQEIYQKKNNKKVKM